MVGKRVVSAAVYQGTLFNNSVNSVYCFQEVDTSYLQFQGCRDLGSSSDPVISLLKHVVDSLLVYFSRVQQTNCGLRHGGG